jgi:hypothetical protein
VGDLLPSRYAALGFVDEARLDKGAMRPASFALELSEERSQPP